ncbi:MAG: hypothetical protein HY268_12305 [Deltaproteobacteria bacterium]|nr:hypothetical protein [Deltaproteobacteria bacterium]
MMSAKAKEALNRYVAELVYLYPSAAGHYRVEPWLGHEQTYLVSIVLPQDEDVWMDLNEAMSVVATDLVVETDCLFVLTTLE